MLPNAPSNPIQRFTLSLSHHHYTTEDREEQGRTRPIPPDSLPWRAALHTDGTWPARGRSVRQPL